MQRVGRRSQLRMSNLLIVEVIQTTTAAIYFLWKRNLLTIHSKLIYIRLELNLHLAKTLINIINEA
ncbi:hypothetical protein SAMN04488518_107284 [Pseudovibrio ascidiaceicola]|uniref:Uncharacterized protein n=1 Tax=Pseudovibrio ascidiaceicola TaxID=285279 RepID=A0A1I4BCG4_9HYPH|nr:hypothetical protein SAMN04488518_107284 [Pseudovibrio ascidiaceicola]